MNWRAYGMGAFNALVLALLAWVIFLPPVHALQILTRPAATAYDAIAAEFGLSIVWDVADCPGEDWGCWRAITPDQIYVSPALGEHDVTLSVVLHEIGHAMANRIGNDPTDECAAEAFAKGLGATVQFYPCA